MACCGLPGRSVLPGLLELATAIPSVSWPVCRGPARSTSWGGLCTERTQAETPFPLRKARHTQLSASTAIKEIPTTGSDSPKSVLLGRYAYRVPGRRCRWWRDGGATEELRSCDATEFNRRSPLGSVPPEKEMIVSLGRIRNSVTGKYRNVLKEVSDQYKEATKAIIKVISSGRREQTC